MVFPRQVLARGAAVSTFGETPPHGVHRRPPPLQLLHSSCGQLIQTQALRQADTSSSVLHCKSRWRLV